MVNSVYRLDVQQIEQDCWFELKWGQEQRLKAKLPYPTELIGLYQGWQRAYLNFYKTVQLAPATADQSPSPMRGRVLGSGDLPPATTTWRSRLVQSEAELLLKFHDWLRRAELYEIRKTIALASQQQPEFRSLDLFLTCGSLELARLPWEVWEISSEFALSGAVHIVRTPLQIRSEATPPSSRRHSRARVLAILGDDTGLNFQTDREAVKSLSRIAEVRFIGWQPDKTIAQVQTEICEALVDERGWDVLFFAGHSNETQLTGGELAIAPGVSLSISELAPHLQTARERGVQFALFNSCSGLRIAETLIDLGFSQVAVMREPIHNRVAQEFLVGFLTHLAQHQDVHESLLAACQMLKSDKNMTYPSAYLIPSLFCHPGASRYQIPRGGWRQWLRQWTPQRYEAIVCGVSLLLALLPPVQSMLLDQRLLAQAVYRQESGQVPAADAPPVTLVLIDDASTRSDPRLTRPSPIDRSYLADVIRQLSQRGAQVIGIDFLLDRQTGNESVLQQALRQAVQQQGTWFVFGTLYDPFEAQGIFTTERPQIAPRTWTMQGYVSLWPDRVTLPYPQEDCQQTCPFAYLISLTHLGQQALEQSFPQPDLDHSADLRAQVIETVQQPGMTNQSLSFVRQSHLSWLSALTSEVFYQVTLEPIIDFSIPPDRIYQGVSAWQLLQDPNLELPDLSEQVVIIGAGDYTDGGEVEQGQLDLFPVPSAVAYWRKQLPPDNRARFATGDLNHPSHYLRFYTGAEAHAYMVHHFLNQRLVIPIPNLWMVGLAIVLGKGTLLLAQRFQFRPRTSWQRRGVVGGLIAASTLYGIVSLQLYLSAGILFPWLLPTATVWAYVLPILNRKRHA